MQRGGPANRYCENSYEDMPNVSASKQMMTYHEMKSENIPYELNALINRS